MVCGLCGRQLKDSKSIQRGYGPTCYQKANPSSMKATACKNYGSVEEYIIPGQMGISEFIVMPKGY